MLAEQHAQERQQVVDVLVEVVLFVVEQHHTVQEMCVLHALQQANVQTHMECVENQLVAVMFAEMM